MLVWVPYDDVVPHIPAAMAVDVYDGTGEPPSTSDKVEFYVLPYTFDDTPLRLMAHMPRLRMVQTLTAGYEHVLPHLPDGVRLYNAGGVHDASTAELALTLILAALRGVPEFVRAQERGEWRHERHDALADKRVLIVGYGGVGIAVDQRLAGFEVTVRRVAQRAREGVAAVRDLPQLLPEADVVVLAVPLTDSTRGLVDRAFLERLPDHALVVNVARGAIIDTEALLAELHSGRLRAALDVMDIEPLPADHPLWHAPGVLLSPHVGGDTTAFLPRAKRLIIDQLHRYAAGEAVLYDVTPDDAGSTGQE
jgi:phosphoglycerate dehydrogenase-like enzyme